LLGAWAIAAAQINAAQHALNAARAGMSFMFTPRLRLVYTSVVGDFFLIGTIFLSREDRIVAAAGSVPAR
jgi:hypothetical protein